MNHEQFLADEIAGEQRRDSRRRLKRAVIGYPLAGIVLGILVIIGLNVSGRSPKNSIAAVLTAQTQAPTATPDSTAIQKQALEAAKQKLAEVQRQADAAKQAQDAYSALAAANQSLSATARANAYSAAQAAAAQKEKDDNAKALATQSMAIELALAADASMNGGSYSTAIGTESITLSGYGNISSASGSTTGFTTLGYIGSKLSSGNGRAGYYSCMYIGEKLGSCSGNVYMSFTYIGSHIASVFYAGGSAYFSSATGKISSISTFGPSGNYSVQ